jgi:hypothetical protein
VDENTLKQLTKPLAALLGIAVSICGANLQRAISHKSIQKTLVLKLEPAVIPIPDYQSPWLRPGWRDCGTDEKALHEQAEEAKKVRP